MHHNINQKKNKNNANNYFQSIGQNIKLQLQQ